MELNKNKEVKEVKYLKDLKKYNSKIKLCFYIKIITLISSSIEDQEDLRNIKLKKSLEKILFSE